MAAKNLVLIENPVPGGARFLKMKRALRHVESGLAEFTGPTRIRLFGKRHISALDRAEMAAMERDWRYDALVDNGKPAPLHHIAGLPVIKPVVLITNPTTRHIYNRFERNGPVIVIVKDGEPVTKAA